MFPYISHKSTARLICDMEPMHAQPRGQPGNRGQWRSSTRPDTASTSTLTLYPSANSDATAVVTGDGPYNVSISADSSSDFQGMLRLIKAIKGRRYDPGSKTWVIPDTSAYQLAQALENIAQQGWTVIGSSLVANAQPAPAGPVATASIGGSYGNSQRIEFGLEYEQFDLRQQLRDGLPISWDKEAKVWYMPLPSTPSGWGRLRKVTEPLGVELSPQLDGLATSSLSYIPDTEVLENMPLKLRDYQVDGAKFAMENRRILLADEPGLGKTIQSLAAVKADNQFPLVVVCPAFLRTNWKREASTMCPEASIEVLDPVPQGSPPSKSDIVIVSYNTLKDRSEWLPSNPKSVIYDEMHYIQNPDAQRTQAASDLIDRLDSTGMVLGLSGTPIRNRPVNLIPFLSMTGLIDNFGGKWRFMNRYCNPEKIYIRKQKKWVTSYNGYDNLEELNSVLSDGIMIRRRKSEVLDDLPAKTTILTPLDLSSPMRALYEKCQYNVAESLASSHMDSLKRISAAETGDDDEDYEDIDNDVSLSEEEKSEAKARRAAASDVLNTIIKEGVNAEIEKKLDRSVRQVVSDSAVGQMSFLRKFASVAKLPEVINHIEDWLDSTEPDRKLVLFAHHRSIVRMLADRFQGGMLIGGMPTSKRDEAIEKFTNETEPRVLVCSIAAAGVGLNLQVASDVKFVEQPWTPADCIQAEDRCHRIGQTKGVMAEYLVASGTVDEYVAQVIEEKRAIAGDAIDGVGNWDDELTKAVDNWMNQPDDGESSLF